MGKAFKSLGDNALVGVKNWWRNGPDLSKAYEVRALKDIPNQVWKMKTMDIAISKEMTGFTIDASKMIKRDIDKLATHLKEKSAEVTRIERLLLAFRSRLSKSKIDLDKAAPELKGGIVDSIRGQDESVVAMEKQLSVVMKERALLETRKGQLSRLNNVVFDHPRELAAELEKHPQMMEEFSALRHWKTMAEEFVPRQNMIAQSVSRHISNDRKFVREYLEEIYPHLQKGRIAKKNSYPRNWLANPKNQQRLEELRKSKKFKQILGNAEHGDSFRDSLVGINKFDLARKLKITGGVGAGLVTAVAFMSWADDSSEEIVQQTAKINMDLGSFTSSGLGAVITEETRSAVNILNKFSKNIDVSIGKDPEKGMTDYFKTLVQQKAILDKNLKRWETVVNSSSDPEVAREVGQGLAVFSKNLEATLRDAGEKTGTTPQMGNTPEMDYGVAGDIRKEPASKEHIKGVQNYLSDRFPMVGPTGNLDRPTLRALKALEMEYDRAADTDRFGAGRLLVRPDEGHLIDLKDLRQLNERMKGYK